MSLIVTFIGFRGILSMNKTYILIHAMSTTAVIGAFCFYAMVEAFFIKREDNVKNI